MASVNKVIIVGNLGRDPEVRYTPEGAAIANVSIATTSKYKSKSGEMVEETEWHRVTFFGRLAEVVGEYLKKGRSVYVEGRLKTNKYTDRDGVERYSTSIIASEMQMLGGKDSGSSEGDGGGFETKSAPGSKPAPGKSANNSYAAARGGSSGSALPSIEDDIPF